MGKASRRKRERRSLLANSQQAEIEVVCPGMLQILSVGKGDIKLTLGPDPDDVDNARKIIEEMLAKGYGIFVETDEGLARVKKFNPKRMSYVISEIVDDVEPAGAEHAGAKKPRRTRDKHVPVAGSKAKAIGRTAGG